MPSTSRSVLLRAALGLLFVMVVGGCGSIEDVHEEEDGTIRVVTANLALSQLSNGCSTSGTEGLSEQLIDEMLCLAGSARLVRVDHPNITLTSTRVHPYLSPRGRDMLLSVAANNRIQINSALRTLAEQYVLQRGCSVAASPGRSNHETGRAIDVQNYSTVGGRLTSAGFSHPLPSSDPVHYEGPGDDLRSLSVQAFQRLWNRNNPSDRIAEDGVAGSQTLSRLARSPAEGFATGGQCTPTMPTMPSCTPTTETCNGLDEDCDGRSDEGVQNACGSCGPVPTETCNADDDDCDGRVDENLSCAPTCTPRAESCNSADDDCDGSIDEGISCGSTCTPRGEECNERDDDCDGLVDENIACGGTPTPTPTCTPAAESCDGRDQDCDGRIDEGTCGSTPVCEAETCNRADDDCDGRVDELPTCSGGCEPIGETCNRRDDDCDDLIDEDLTCEQCVPSDETCDGADEDCDDVIDEGVCVTELDDGGVIDPGVRRPRARGCSVGTRATTGTPIGWLALALLVMVRRVRHAQRRSRLRDLRS